MLVPPSVGFCCSCIDCSYFSRSGPPRHTFWISIVHSTLDFVEPARTNDEFEKHCKRRPMRLTKRMRDCTHWQLPHLQKCKPSMPLLLLHLLNRRAPLHMSALCERQEPSSRSEVRSGVVLTWVQGAFGPNPASGSIATLGHVKTSCARSWRSCSAIRSPKFGLRSS
jgi:hypothetical protein